MDLGPAGRTRPGFTELRRLRGLAGVSEQEERVTPVGGWPGRRRRRRGGVCVPAAASAPAWSLTSGGNGRAAAEALGCRPRVLPPRPVVASCPVLPGPEGSARLTHRVLILSWLHGGSWWATQPLLPPEFSGWEGLRFCPGDLDPLPPSLSVCPSLSFLLHGVGLASRPLSRCCSPTPPRKGPLPSRE